MAEDAQTIIVGDIGGTNVRLAFARLNRDSVTLESVWKQPGSQYATFRDALDDFLAAHPEAEGGSRVKNARGGGLEGGGAVGIALGLAGPVVGGRVEMLHSGWVVDAADIGTHLSTDAVLMVNDFVAMARSAPELTDDQTQMLSEGSADPIGNIVVGGPGTGFGLGTLKQARSGQRPAGWVVVGGEGGHQAFSPETDLEWRVAETLRANGVYVSNEVIASGSGFRVTLDALAMVLDLPVTTDDPAAIIEQAEKGDALALALCRLRARCTMAALGDAALAANATGGVFIAGGVSPYLEPWLTEAEAIARFRKRGPRSPLLADIPIRLVTGDKGALLGAAALWRDKQERGWI